MKSLVFDAGPIISLTTNNLLEICEPLQMKFKGDFLLPEAVKKELVDNPLNIKRFEFEALQVEQQINCGTFKVISDEKTRKHANELLEIANSVFSIKGNPLTIVHYGEMSALAAALLYNAEAIAIDERTTRDLVEGPAHMAAHMARKFNAKIKTNEDSLKQFRKQVGNLKIIRSVELATMAYELGLLSKYIEKCRIPDLNVKKILLDSVLWGVKLQGCAVSRIEIEQIMKMEKF